MEQTGQDNQAATIGREPAAGSDGFAGFTHLDERGNARMVDVTGKATTDRRAIARGRVVMDPATSRQLEAGAVDPGGGGGDVLGTARTAALFAAKSTSDLLPLCHPLQLGDIVVAFEILDGAVEITVGVEAMDRTGVEMEALTACLVAALTVYERCKSIDAGMSIEDVAVWEKSGGRSGRWQRDEDGSVHHTGR